MVTNSTNYNYKTDYDNDNKAIQYKYNYMQITDRGQIIGPTLFGPTLQQTDLSTDRTVFGPIHVF